MSTPFLRAVNSSLAESPDLVLNFLKLVSKEVRPLAKEDFREMEKMKKEQYRYSRVSHHHCCFFFTHYLENLF